MTIRAGIAQVLLFVTIVVWAIWLGGQVFNASTFISAWSGDLPASLIGWRERSEVTFGGSSGQARFFSTWGNRLVVFMLTTLIASWKLRTRRPWLIGATVVMLTMVALLFVMIPEQGKLTSPGNYGITGAELVSRAERWVLLNRIRIGLEVVGLLCLLRALSIAAVTVSRTEPPAPNTAVAAIGANGAAGS